MDFDFTELPERDRYRLLCSFVAPRPIALVTTVSGGGLSNAAPMSFFNVFAHEPPIVILGVSARPDGTPKDTLVNIRETGEFVVNLCDLTIAQQMVDCGINFPRGVDEVEKAGLSLAPSRQVKPGRVSESPCSMECRLFQSIEFPGRSIVLGQVVQMNVRDDCLDEDGHYVRPDVYQPIARLHADNYIVADRQFVLTPNEALKLAEIA
ncbi:MAG TPA: flavin reductase family protein [Thermohalobaculum sp.]|nr:flavin reductase family protein [Thermohalobaculum sp.]